MEVRRHATEKNGGNQWSRNKAKRAAFSRFSSKVPSWLRKQHCSDPLQRPGQPPTLGRQLEIKPKLNLFISNIFCHDHLVRGHLLPSAITNDYYLAKTQMLSPTDFTLSADIAN